LGSEDHRARLLLEVPEPHLRDKAVAEAYTEAAHTLQSGDRYHRVMAVLYEKRTGR